MPNHVVNIVSFQGDDAQIQKMLSEVQNDEFGPGSISFQKLIPMPPELDIESGSRTNQGLKAYMDFSCQYFTAMGLEKLTLDNVPEGPEKAYLQAHPDLDRETFLLGKKASDNIDKYGAPTWYDWRIDHWGTKWDAYGYDEGKDYSKAKELRFLTAWSAPHPILQRLSEQYPALEITHQWADEDIGFNCGIAVYRAGEQTELEVKQDDELANQLWESYDNAGYPPNMEQQI